MKIFSPIIFTFIFINLISAQKKIESVPDINVEFSIEGGYYDEEIFLELACPGARIYYTLDGSEPNRKSFRYRKKLKITETMPVRAVAYREKKKSAIIGHTYFIDEPTTTIPTVAVMINPDYLFDPENGLYVTGNHLRDSTWRKTGANFWSKKELFANTEIYEVDGEQKFCSGTGFRLFGGMSRLFPQKSMTLVARREFGENKFRVPIFGKKGPKRFKFFVLRNSGSDFGRSNFRDVFMTSLLKGWDIEKQNFRPAQVYLNGDYWGLYNIREKVNRFFIADYFDVDKDSINLIEHQFTRKRGNRGDYLRMIRFIEKSDFSISENYEYIKTKMDVTNFIDYKIAQIYFDNKDAGGNIKYWKEKGDKGKWRWILYDTDWGFGLQSSKAYKFNSLDFHLEPDGPAWPNPPWSTLVLRKLMENKEFQNEFLLRFQDYLNTTFEDEVVSDHLDKIVKIYSPEMERHFKRWNLTMKQWSREINKMRTFGLERPDVVWQFLGKRFNLNKKYNLKIETTIGGNVRLNEHVKINKHAFEGKYFHDFPCKIEAISKNGYTFSHWEGIESKSRTLTLSSDKDYQLKAIFKRYIHPMSGRIVINEVAANDKKSGDWIEIFNNSYEAVDVTNWILADKKHEFRIPKITIPAKGYLVIVQNKIKFKKAHPMVSTYVGDLGFGINKKKEIIQLFSDKGEMIDSIGYDIEPLDTVFCLNLLLPELENGDDENWEILKNIGSPSKANPYYLESKIKHKQKTWMRIGGILGGILILGFILFLKGRSSYE